MSLNEDALEEVREQWGRSDDGMWIGPGIIYSLETIVEDITTAGCALSLKIKESLEETRNLTGEEQWLFFDHLVSGSERLLAVRTSLFRLLVAISCEELINRFCYFELPREMSETLEKLQPTEKLLIAAAYLGQPGIKSSHVYEGLRNIMAWRNQYAHGHNPGHSTGSLRKNHAVLPTAEMIARREDGWDGLKRTARHYCDITTWLPKSARHSINKFDITYREAPLFVEFFECFRFTREWFPPDSEGIQRGFEDLHVDTERLEQVRLRLNSVIQGGEE